MSAEFVCQSPAYLPDPGAPTLVGRRVRFLCPIEAEGIEIGDVGRVVNQHNADDITYFIQVRGRTVSLEDCELWYIETLPR